MVKTKRLLILKKSKVNSRKITIIRERVCRFWPDLKNEPHCEAVQTCCTTTAVRPLKNTSQSFDAFSSKTVKYTATGFSLFHTSLRALSTGGKEVLTKTSTEKPFAEVADFQTPTETVWLIRLTRHLRKKFGFFQKFRTFYDETGRVNGKRSFLEFLENWIRTWKHCYRVYFVIQVTSPFTAWFII